MKIASYVGTRSGFIGVFNRLIRLRFGGSFLRDGTASHTEIIFEPKDNVDYLLPDGNSAPDAQGAVWFASSSAHDPIPTWARRRAGRIGGVRFKRIVLDPNKWEIADFPHDPEYAARWFRNHEGNRYDWGLIVGFMFWPVQYVVNHLFPTTVEWSACSSAAASAGRYSEPDFYHPELLRDIYRTHQDARAS